MLQLGSVSFQLSNSSNSTTRTGNSVELLAHYKRAFRQLKFPMWVVFLYNGHIGRRVISRFLEEA
jgi:hypothetical protein